MYLSVVLSVDGRKSQMPFERDMQPFDTVTNPGYNPHFITLLTVAGPLVMDLSSEILPIAKTLVRIYYQL